MGILLTLFVRRAKLFFDAHESVEIAVGLVLGNYVEELLLLAVEGGGEPVGHGAADAVFGMATGNTIFEEDAVALELKADGSDVAV